MLFGCDNFANSSERLCLATDAAHFRSKLSKVIGADGPVGSGVGVGVGCGVGVGEGVGVIVGVGVGEGVGVIVGVGVGLTTIFRCQVNLLPFFLQIREPEVELTLAHLAPNLATAP